MYEGQQIGVARGAIGLGQPSQQKAVDKSPTEHLLDEMRLAQNGVHDAISRLEARLSTVLGMAFPEPGVTEKSDNTTSVSALCDELGIRVGVSRNAEYRINKLIGRLTV
jgi:hypothetical protein